jgi:hypothetical protein
VSTCSTTRLSTDDAEAQLHRALLTYDPGHDEIFQEVHARIVAHGAATKLDLGALVFWKHINNSPWMSRLLAMPATQVRAVTAAAFAPGLSDAERVQALRPLPGFGAGLAMASVLLSAWDPSRFAVYDRLALTSRRSVVSESCGCDWNNLITYFEHLRRLSDELSGPGWTPRLVDMALFCLGGLTESTRPAASPDREPATTDGDLPL